MASSEQLRSGEDYALYFTPQDYTNAYYSQVEGPYFLQFFVESLHKIYSQGKVNGHRLLEIGTGPCVHTVMPAAKWFDEIILTDFTPANRDMLEKWLQKSPDAFTWEPFAKFYSKLDGNESNWQAMETEVRNKVTSVLPCDVHLPNPIYPEELGLVDVICTSLCIESASPDIAKYQKAMQNVVSLLKPGGQFILMGVLGNPFYSVGTEKFYCLSLTKQDVLDAIKMAGLTVIEIFVDDGSMEGDVDPYNGSLVIHAVKL